MEQRNRVRCNKCQEIIESKHRHDFVWCKCHHVAVDGGMAYSKRVWKDEPDWCDVVEKEDGTLEFVNPDFDGR